LTEKHKEITKGKIKNSWTSIICLHEWNINVKRQRLEILLLADEAMDMNFSYFMEKNQTQRTN